MASKNENRVLWIERAQVLSMLLVVLHHCVPHGYDGPAWLLNLLTAIQYPALVCFFLTSGLLAAGWRKRGWAAYMKRRCLRLLPPYLCVNLLMLVPRYVAARMMGVEVRLTAGWVFASFLDPHGQGIAPHLWFLLTLLIMNALLPLIDLALGRGKGLRAGVLAALLIASALPVKLPTFLCLNELKLYLAWYALGYALALARGRRNPLKDSAGLTAGLTGLAVFIAALFFPDFALATFLQMAGGGLFLIWLSGCSDADDPLTRTFRGRTYCVYILSMCVQNLAEVVGYSARLPWFVTFLMMLAAGLAVPVLLCRWNEKHPLPGWLRAIVGL